MLATPMPGWSSNTLVLAKLLLNSKQKIALPKLPKCSPKLSEGSMEFNWPTFSSRRPAAQGTQAPSLARRTLRWHW